MALGINTNIPGLSANRFLLGSTRKVNSALQKLSSGFRVNQAKDGPAALVISELLRSQTSGLQQAVQNTQEANNVLSIAEGGLSEMSSMLTRMRQLAVHASNSGITSSAQISADQAEMNGMLSAISRLANTTSFGSQQLLNGSQSIVFSASDADGILDLAGSNISEVADISGQTVNLDYSGNVADQAEKAYLETNLGGGPALAQDQSFTITGNQGNFDFNFTAGTSITDMADIINNRSDTTGVTAYAINGGTELRLVSNEYGADATVSVQQTQGTAFAAVGQTVTDQGQNATLTVAGEQMQTSGLNLEVESQGFAGTFAFNADNAGATTIAQTGYDQDVLTDATAARSATISDIKGGMRFQLGGGAGTQNRDIFSLGSAQPANLGQVSVNGQNYSLNDLFSGGSASLANNPDIAMRVIDQAIQDVSSQRAKIGAYQANTLQTNANALGIAIENMTATESAIRDTDMAAQITQFIQAQLQQKAGIMGVQSANVNAQNVLKLLGG